MAESNIQVEEQAVKRYSSNSPIEQDIYGFFSDDSDYSVLRKVRKLSEGWTYQPNLGAF